MNLLEMLGILFLAIISVNVIIGLIAMKKALPEESFTANLVQDRNLDSLRISKI